MKRLAVALLGLALLVAPLTAEAQQTTKVQRVGVLLSNSQSSHSSHVEAFRQGLRERGYVEGRNIVVEYRYGDGKLDRLPKVTIRSTLSPTSSASLASQAETSLD